MPSGLLGVIVPYVLRTKKGDSLRENQDEAAEVQEEEQEGDLQILAKRRRVDILNSFYLRDLERAFEVIHNESLQEGASTLQDPIFIILRMSLPSHATTVSIS